MSRALRIMLVANDGFSVGHVVRTIAIARALDRIAEQRGVAVRMLLVTTSEAHALLADVPLAVVRLPAPVAARRAGFEDAERRHLVRATIEGASEGFSPDLVVVDTFPNGPHGELAGLARRGKRALIRRAVPDERTELLVAGIERYDRVIVAADPEPIASGIARAIHVPPITLDGPLRSKIDARRALGLPGDGRAILVASGGGGDVEAARRVATIRAAIERIAPDTAVYIARGPLESSPSPAPLQPYFAAFDGAIVPAGYNTAHELAAARVPAALFAQPRPFDDQAARAARFAALGYARVLEQFSDEELAGVLAWFPDAPRPLLEAGGAARAAEALLDLAGVPA